MESTKKPAEIAARVGKAVKARRSMVEAFHGMPGGIMEKSGTKITNRSDAPRRVSPSYQSGFSSFP